MSRTETPSSDQTAALPHIPGYRIVRPLGQGGMATVYLAIQESFEREVALKLMAPALLAADETFGERFLREARIVARIIHPHIVTVHDVGVHQGRYFLAMEYVPGTDLRESRARLSLRQCLSAIRQIAGALDEAHHMGYVHRDIKPENILIHRNGGRAVLTDFGIARPLGGDDDSGQLGGTIGTPAFMSPEQALGQPVDHRSDLYSLGVVCYFLLTGQVPYHGESAMAVGMKHALDPIPRLPSTLAAFQHFIDTALAKHADQRFQSGDSFARAIDVLIATLGTEHEQFWQSTTMRLGSASDFTRHSGAEPTRITGLTPPHRGGASPRELSPSVSPMTPDRSTPVIKTTARSDNPWPARLAAVTAALQTFAASCWQLLRRATVATASALARVGRYGLACWRRYAPVVIARVLALANVVARHSRQWLEHLWAHKHERKTQLQLAAAGVVLVLLIWWLNDKDWTTSTARQALREDEISKAEYNAIIKELKAQHQQRLTELREQLEAEDLSHEEYLQAVREAKQEYTGQEDCGSLFGC